MPGIEDLEKAIARFEKAQEDLREEVRNAHAATRELKEARKEAHAWMNENFSRIEQAIVDRVEKELAGLHLEAEQASAMLYEKVGREIDKMVGLALGTKKTRSGAKMDLRPLLAQHLSQWLREELAKAQVELVDEINASSDA